MPHRDSDRTGRALELARRMSREITSFFSPSGGVPPQRGHSSRDAPASASNGMVQEQESEEEAGEEEGGDEEEGEEEEGEEEEGEEEEGEEEEGDDDSSDDDRRPIGTCKRSAGNRIPDSSDEEGAHLDSPSNKQQKS